MVKEIKTKFTSIRKLWLDEGLKPPNYGLPVLNWWSNIPVIHRLAKVGVFHLNISFGCLWISFQLLLLQPHLRKTSKKK